MKRINKLSITSEVLRLVAAIANLTPRTSDSAIVATTAAIQKLPHGKVSETLRCQMAEKLYQCSAAVWSARHTQDAVFSHGGKFWRTNCELRRAAFVVFPWDCRPLVDFRFAKGALSKWQEPVSFCVSCASSWRWWEHREM